MFSQIKKLWRYLCYFFQTRKVWTWPQQSKILIYDAANSEILLEYLKPWNPEILHVREEKIYMRVLLKSFFKKGRRSDAYIRLFHREGASPFRVGIKFININFISNIQIE